MQEKKGNHTKAAIILLSIFIFSDPDITAQLFSNTNSGLPNTLNSAVNWVDINRDGFLELSISGEPYEASYTGLGILYFFNNTTHVIASSKNIRTISAGDHTWSDFNNDGIPDLLYAGTDAITTQVTAGVDTFDVSYNYHTKFSGFIPVGYANVDWGDYDNDGDYDVFLSGKEASGNIIGNLYNNNRGIFTLVNSGLPGVVDGKVRFIDYDLDQDLDLFITGLDINGNKYTRLWKNTLGAFQVTSDAFLNLRWSQIDWSDVNADGYPDLLLSGYDDTAERSMIYSNNSGSGFTLSGFSVPVVQRGFTCAGDADNDGDPDAVITGIKPDVASNNKFVFYNNGSNFLTYDSFISDPVYYSFAQFGDYDNDNDLDFVMNGVKEDGNGSTQIIKNLSSSPNSKPVPPLNLTTTVEGTSVTLSWDNSTDNNTPPESITYNIYLGVAGNKMKIVSPIADLTTGFRRIARPGYIRDNIWTIKNLPTGTYYWGVQAIDNSLGASAFSAEGTFVINDRFTKVTSTETPSQTSPAMYLDADHDKDLDIILNGSSTFKIIENTLTPFTQTNYRTISTSSYNPMNTITPNDYDNNNLMDFSVSGDYPGVTLLDSSIALYHYFSPFNYTITDAIAKNLNFEYVLWADLDNDGKQDFITSGKTTNLGVNKPATYIYRNKGSGVFQKVSHHIRGFEKTGAVAGDFDNDLDIDIINYGKDSTGAANTFLYINNGNFDFTEKLIPDNALFREYLSYGIVTGDLNLDGQLDIYFGGADASNDKYARVLFNNSTNFTDANLQIRSSMMMSNFWADYDYDGDLDIYSSSSFTLPDNKVRLYKNNDGVLNEIPIDLGGAHHLSLPFMAVNLDNINGLDFLMKINAGNYNQYYDNWGSSTRITTAPANIRYQQDQLDIIMRWDKLSDCPGCTYNIWVGTQPDNVSIMSPMSDLNTGYRYVIQPGNAYLNGSWRLIGLPVGTYYWSVQAIDPSNTGGPWAPVASFTVTQINSEFSYNTVCLKDTTVFTDLSVATDAVIKWKWDFGDGATSLIKNPKHCYASSGNFNVGLWAYSQSGDSAYQIHSVTVKAIPLTGFSADIACQGTSTTFTNTTNINGLTISNWLWNFGDGQSSTSQNPAPHGYINSGDYTSELWAFASNGCNNSIQKTVKVGSIPVAAVTADAPLTFCSGDSVTLSVAYNPLYNYQWKLDGTPLTNADTSSFVARLTGSYTVEIINPVGNCAKTSDPKSVSSQSAPASPLINSSGNVVFCDGDSVVLSVTNNPAYSYAWKLNGGVVGADSNLFVAKLAGTYSLVISNTSGCSANSTNTIDLTVNARPSLPTVSINGSKSFCQGGSVELSVTNITGYTYQWENNGIGISGALTNSYLAQNAGVYSLKISNSDGCVTQTENVTVSTLTAPAAPTITASGSLIFCQGDSVTLSVTNITGYTYQWKLNGGDVGSNSNQFIAKNTGTYNLTVSNSNNCSAVSSNSFNVLVNSLPVASAVSLSGSTTFCSGGSITLSIPSTSGYSYNWRNENGLITDASTNSITTTVSGNYQLDITNPSGCKVKTSPVTVSVKPMPDKPVIASDTYQPGKCLGETPQRLNVRDIVTGNNYQWYKNGIPLSNASTSYLEGFLSQGDYSVEADRNGCKSQSEILTIYYENAPEKPYIYAKGPTIWYLACSNDSAYQYKWYYNGILIQGADKYLYVAKRDLGEYYVSISNLKGCVTASDIIKIPTGATGIEDIDPFKDLKIYPNPTTGLITFEMENQLFGELSIKIITQEGKEVRNLKFDKTTDHISEMIDLSRQPKGAYFVSFYINKYLTNKKIILE